MLRGERVGPLGFDKLRGSDEDRPRGRRWTGKVVDGSVEARGGGDDETLMGGIKDEVAACEEDLAWRGDGCGC